MPRLLLYPSMEWALTGAANTETWAGKSSPLIEQFPPCQLQFYGKNIFLKEGVDKTLGPWYYFLLSLVHRALILSSFIVEG